MSQTPENLSAQYNKIGPVYIVKDNAEKDHVLSVTEWVDIADQNKFHYYLQLNDLKNNSIINKTKIAETKDKPLDHERIIGKLGNTTWILTDSLVGYDVHTLQPVMTEAIISLSYPSMKDNFSRRANSYLLDDEAQVLYITSDKGDGYKLYPSGIIKPDDGINERVSEEYSYEFAAEYKLNDRYTLKYALTCVDTSNQKLYILGSEKETGYVLSYFGTSIFPEQDEDRKLTIVPCHADGEKLDYKKTPPHTGNKSYYKGAFLQKKFYTRAWKNDKGQRLIFFLSDRTEKATVCIAMTDKEGKEKWSTNTNMPLNAFDDYLPADNNLLLWFKQYKKGTKTTHAKVINIDLSSGTQSSY